MRPSTTQKLNMVRISKLHICTVPLQDSLEPIQNKAHVEDFKELLGESPVVGVHLDVSIPSNHESILMSHLWNTGIHNF